MTINAGRVLRDGDVAFMSVRLTNLRPHALNLTMISAAPARPSWPL